MTRLEVQQVFGRPPDRTKDQPGALLGRDSTLCVWHFPADGHAVVVFDETGRAAEYCSFIVPPQRSLTDYLRDRIGF